MCSFDAFLADPEKRIPTWIVASLRKTLGYANPTPIQMQAVPPILSGRDVLASAPTGSGKTMAFLLPLVCGMVKGEGSCERLLVEAVPAKSAKKDKKSKLKKGKKGKEGSSDADGSKPKLSSSLELTARVIVLDPTRELAQQTLREFKKLTATHAESKWLGSILDSVSLAQLAGGGTDAASSEKLRIHLDLAVCTPLRLCQLLKDGECTLRATRALVLDEVDKLLDLGFTEQIDSILAGRPAPAADDDASAGIQMLLFSATLPQNVVELGESILVNPISVRIGDAAAANKSIEQRLVFVGNSEANKLSTFINLVKEGALKSPCLVFCQSKERVNELHGEAGAQIAALLGGGGGGATGISAHERVAKVTAEQSKTERDEVIRKFRANKIWFLITTDMLSRGVDFKNIQSVLNYDIPQAQSTYIHRIGRTGRAGKKGYAVTLYTE